MAVCLPYPPQLMLVFLLQQSSIMLHIFFFNIKSVKNSTWGFQGEKHTFFFFLALQMEQSRLWDKVLQNLRRHISFNMKGKINLSKDSTWWLEGYIGGKHHSR